MVEWLGLRAICLRRLEASSSSSAKLLVSRLITFPPLLVVGGEFDMDWDFNRLRGREIDRSAVPFRERNFRLFLDCHMRVELDSVPCHCGVPFLHARLCGEDRYFNYVCRC